MTATPDLTLAQIGALWYQMPLKRSYGTARGTATAGINFLVQLQGDYRGRTFEGVGECQPRHALTGDGGKDRVAAWGFLCAAVDYLDGRTLNFDEQHGAVLAIRALMAELNELAVDHADAGNKDRPFRGTLLGIEVALLDVVSRALGLEIAELLGKKRDDVAVSISTISSATSLDEVADKAVKQHRYPITRVKGIGEIAYDLDLLDRVSNANHAAGRVKPIWIDINEALDLPQASDLITAIAARMRREELPSSIVVEGILPKAEVTKLPRLQQLADDATRTRRWHRRKLDLRIMPDEGMWDATDLARVSAAGGCRALNIKAPKAGGLLASLDLAKAAVEADPDVHICIGGMLGTSDITAFALHNLARAMPRIDYLTTVPPTNVKQRISEPRAAYQAKDSNVISRQSQPGLGTRLDANKIMPYVEATYGALDTVPTLQVTERTRPGSGKPVATVTFAGDTSLGDVHIKRKGGELARRLESEPMSFFSGVRPLVSDQDALILNLETVLADSPMSPFEGQKRFLGWDSPERSVECLRKLGVDAVSLANNHTMDFGHEHLLAMRKLLEDAGIRPFGAGATATAAKAPLTLELNTGQPSRRVHIIGTMEVQTKLRDEFGFYAGDDHPGIHGISVPDIIGQIRQLRSDDPSSLIIVFPHWGGNYKWVRENTQRAAEQFIDAGANLIIGHGAHMLQQATFGNDHAVAYSLGNFVFNWAGRFTEHKAPPFGLVARVELSTIDDAWDVGLRLYPFICDNKRTDYRPRPVTDEEFETAWSTLHSADLDGSFSRHVRTERDSRGLHFAYSFLTGTPSSAGAVQAPATATGTPAIGESDVLSAFHRGSTTYLLARAVVDRGLPHKLERLPGGRSTPSKQRPALRFSVGESDYFVRGGTIVKARQDGSPGLSIDGQAVQLCKRKDLTAGLLRNAGFSVPAGMAFGRSDVQGALLYFDAVNARLDHGLCVKPAAGSKGRSIYLNIRDRESFRSAFERVSLEFDPILVEETVQGTVYRFLTIDGSVAAVRYGRPASVRGDGRRTVEELVSARNDELRERGADRHNVLRLGDHEREFLAASGWTGHSVPDDGARVFLSSLSNRHAAAEMIDCSDDVHPSYRDVVEAVTAQIPGLTVCGIDVMIDDITRAAAQRNHFFIELNTTPGIRGHHNPSEGRSRDVAGEIIEYVVAKQP